MYTTTHAPYTTTLHTPLHMSHVRLHTPLQTPLHHYTTNGRYRTDLVAQPGSSALYNAKTKSLFFSDNSLELMQRDIDPSASIPAKFYPMNTACALRDGRGTARQITMLTRQPIGATSQSGGHLEMMIARNLRSDDGRGLAQGMLLNRFQSMFSLCSVYVQL